MENTWQVCPKCNGNKQLLNNFAQPVQCHICNGFGIISQLTGLPPTTNGEVFKYYPPITQPYLGDKKLYHPYKIDDMQNICKSVPEGTNLEG